MSELSKRYSFVRARQLERTVRLRGAVGIWPITGFRIQKGWGHVTLADWPDSSTGTSDWPPPEPPGLDEKAKAFRIPFYQRCATLAQVRTALDGTLPVIAAFEIGDEWIAPANGLIPVPRRNDKITAAHAVVLESYDDQQKLLRFRNYSWPNWGDNGYGYLPYSYLGTRLIDAFVKPPGRRVIEAPNHQGVVVLAWNTHSLVDQAVLHVIEIHDTVRDEMIAWAFAIVRSEYVEVEELFVRPRFRRRGFGSSLLHQLASLSEQSQRPLRFTVPYADIADQERRIFGRMVRKVGYKLVPGAARWAPYSGVPARPMEALTIPARPRYVPARPTAGPSFLTAGKGTAAAVTSAALAFQVAGYSGPMLDVDNELERAVFSAGDSLPIVSDYPIAVSAPESQGSKGTSGEGKSRLVIGSAEYDKKNARRVALIRKRVRPGLNSEEEAEFQDLQAEILEVTKRAHPHPPTPLRHPIPTEDAGSQSGSRE